jgi:LysM repeat protein
MESDMMKQIIPFIKEVKFEDGLGSIVSISLEHEAFVDTSEVNGNFFVYGEYKKKLDSSEVFEFREKIPFNLLVPDNLIQDTVNVDIDDFTYELLNDNKIKVCIDLSLCGEEIKVRDKDDVRDLVDIYDMDEKIENNINVDIDSDVNISNVTNNIQDYIKNDVSNYVEQDIVNDNDVNVENEINDNSEVTEVGEYVIYHIHTVNEGDTLESIINKYDTNIDILKEYNDVSKLDVGTKLVIPEVYYGTN